MLVELVETADDGASIGCAPDEFEDGIVVLGLTLGLASSAAGVPFAPQPALTIVMAPSHNALRTCALVCCSAVRRRAAVIVGLIAAFGGRVPRSRTPVGRGERVDMGGINHGDGFAHRRKPRRTYPFACRGESLCDFSAGLGILVSTENCWIPVKHVTQARG